MKKVIVIAAASFFDESSGVTQKVLSQARAFHELGACVDCIGYDGNNDIVLLKGITKNSAVCAEVIGHVKNKKTKRIALWMQIKKHMLTNHYDLAYVRYPVFDSLVLHALKQMRRACGHIVMEVPSFPLVYNGHGILKRMQYETDHMLQKKCGRFLDRVLYVGNKTETVFGCDAVQIPNGLPDAIRVMESTEYSIKEDEINLICVSNMYPIHGYDRLIKGLGHYYQGGEHKQKVRITMVGNGPCEDEYKRLAKELQIEEHIRFTGTLKGEALSEEYSRATLGVGSLGLFKEGLREASSLKTKEYLLRGLPFVYAVDEIGLEEDFPYAIKVSNDEQAVSIERIVAFVDSLRNLNKGTVSAYMKAYAEKNYNWKSILERTCMQYLPN